MEERRIERLGRDVSVVGLGTWQLGADWGEVEPAAAHAVLDAAVQAGVTFFDTADVYGDGRSERFCGELRARHPGVFVATKMGRRAEQLPENYNAAAFRAWNDALAREPRRRTARPRPAPLPARRGLSRTTPSSTRSTSSSRRAGSAPTGSRSRPARRRCARSRGQRVATVQIILNCFRLKPLEEVLPAARAAGVGIIARVPLASGLLSGRYDEHTTFAPDDHRTYNRHGEAFDVGETFSGVPFETGVAAARELQGAARPGRDARPVRAALGDRPARREHRDPRARATPSRCSATWPRLRCRRSAPSSSGGSRRSTTA